MISKKEIQISAGILISELNLTLRQDKCDLSINPGNAILISVMSGESEVKVVQTSRVQKISRFESLIYISYFNEPLQLLFKSWSDDCHIFVSEISLKDLHELVAPASSGSLDYKSAVPSSDAYNGRIIETSPKVLAPLNVLFATQIDNHMLAVFQKAKFTEYFALLMAQILDGQKGCPYIPDEELDKKIREFKAMLLKDLTEIPSLNSISKQLGSSKYSLSDGFKRKYGKSPQEFLFNYKMELSCSMLDSGKYMVKEVAYDLGYQNPSHFIAAFRKRYGQTPKTYLKG